MINRNISGYFNSLTQWSDFFSKSVLCGLKARESIPESCHQMPLPPHAHTHAHPHLCGHLLMCAYTPNSVRIMIWRPSKSQRMIRSLLPLWHCFSPSRSTFCRLPVDCITSSLASTSGKYHQDVGMTLRH